MQSSTCHLTNPVLANIATFSFGLLSAHFHGPVFNASCQQKHAPASQNNQNVSVHSHLSSPSLPIAVLLLLVSSCIVAAQGCARLVQKVFTFWPAVFISNGLRGGAGARAPAGWVVEIQAFGHEWRQHTAAAGSWVDMDLYPYNLITI